MAKKTTTPTTATETPKRNRTRKMTTIRMVEKIMAIRKKKQSLDEEELKVVATLTDEQKKVVIQMADTLSAVEKPAPPAAPEPPADQTADVAAA